VRSLVRLAHAHIVRVLDVGEHEGLPFPVMQFLAGGFLRERTARLAPGGPAAAQADLASWLPGVANALDYIHSQGYVHRDVKPDNILFGGIGHVCLGDFGIVKALAGAEEARTTAFRTTAGLVIGTPQYVAPELMVGGAASGAADQYALGVTACEAVCGRLPFDGATAVALAVQHATRRAEDTPGAGTRARKRKGGSLAGQNGDLNTIFIPLVKVHFAVQQMGSTTPPSPLTAKPRLSETARFPSGRKATKSAPILCPSKASIGRPVATSHRRTAGRRSSPLR
jgi:serine/threonine protein kinase